MKRQSKKERELEKREEHKAVMREVKARRRGEPILERAKSTKPVIPTMLIVCEGKNTEPSYFRQFRFPAATITIIGEGENTLSLVKTTCTLCEDKEYDRVWCVFDKDECSNNNFNSAIEKAKVQGYGVAYSNQAFEYWLLLHFEDHQGGALDRKRHGKLLNRYLEPFGVAYEPDGNKKVSEEFFELLMGTDERTKKRRVELAIERAKRNYNRFDHRSPADEESSTTVFELVEELLCYMK